MRRFLTAVSIGLLAFAADPARAATVVLDFDHVQIAPGSSLGLPRTIGDFKVTYSGVIPEVQGVISSPTGSAGLPGPFNGTNYLTTFDGSFTISLIPEGHFSLASFDAAETFPGDINNPLDNFFTDLWARQIDVSGTRADGSTVTLPAPFDLDLQNDGQGPLADFENFLVTGFDNLVSVTFTGLGGLTVINNQTVSGYSLDNITLTNVFIFEPEPDPGVEPVTPIPLPASGLLFLAGLGGLGLLVWRRERHETA